MYRIDIMTLFPESVETVLRDSIIGRARDRGHIAFKAWQIRDYTTNKQKQTDDYPYGGGRGCVMYAQPLADCKRAIEAEAGQAIHTIYLTPAGKPFKQDDAKRLAREYDRLILVCGHYEGVDERFIEACVDEEISLGDFVLTGGEIPALALADAVFRLVPGVLPDEECFEDESHWDGLLEYPQYTRPEIWENKRVPEILLSGHHANIRKWRREQAELRTKQRRPDLLKKTVIKGVVMDEKPATIDQYIAQCAPELKERLHELREVIRTAAPDAKEKISWGMPTFYMRRNLVHFAAQTKHIGLYPGVDAVEAFRERLAEYKTSKGAIQFPHNKPVPYDLVTEIVRFCVENGTGA